MHVYAFVFSPEFSMLFQPFSGEVVDGWTSQGGIDDIIWTHEFQNMQSNLIWEIACLRLRVWVIEISHFDETD